MRRLRWRRQPWPQLRSWASALRGRSSCCVAVRSWSPKSPRRRSAARARETSGQVMPAKCPCAAAYIVPWKTVRSSLVKLMPSGAEGVCWKSVNKSTIMMSPRWPQAGSAARAGGGGGHAAGGGGEGQLRGAAVAGHGGRPAAGGVRRGGHAHAGRGGAGAAAPAAARAQARGRDCSSHVGCCAVSSVARRHLSNFPVHPPSKYKLVCNGNCVFPTRRDANA